jgi:hypothetical protein
MPMPFLLHAEGRQGCGLGIAPLNDMRILVSIRVRPILVAAILFTVSLLATDTKAQSLAQERANASRAQLIDLQAKQESLRSRLRHLEEELKPENIEKSLAGIGSTRPEDLRELRRRQLEIEKTNIESQLKLLAESRTRLETSIAQADTDAYHQSAGNRLEESRQLSAAQPTASVSRVIRRERRTKNRPKRQRTHRLTHE